VPMREPRSSSARLRAASIYARAGNSQVCSKYLY
jgi:hypothetical protein